MQWADRIGRRIKLRDLHVLLAVAEARSISRAADLLAISHPVVSRTISELEQTLGARLFDRSSQGVNLTMHGQAFLDCSVTVFDDLRSGVQRLEFLSDPASGEVRIGSYDIIVAGPRSRWIGRQKIDWAEVLNEPWIMPEPDSTIGLLLAKGLRSIGLETPKLTVMSNSIPLRNRLLATGRYLSVLPRSMLQLGAQHPQVRILPIRLPEIAQPVELITLKNRTLSPTASLFIERAREIAKTVGDHSPAPHSKQRS